jgi:DNA-binding beta-propeller fold protein YncE
LALSPNGKTLYAFISDPGKTVTTVTPISTATNKAGKPVPVGQGPLTIAFSPDSKTAYVASSGEGAKVWVHSKLTPVSTATGKPAPFLKLGPAADEITLAVMPDGSRIYAGAIWNGNKDNSTWSISTAPLAFTKHWFGPGFPRAMALTPDAKTLFIVDAAPGGIGIVENITTTDNRFHPGFWVGREPTAITILP